MARLGVDFGTTNTIVVMHDRGMFHVVNHEAQTGAGRVIQESFPSAILIDRESRRRWFGIEADRRFARLGVREDHVFLPSLKRKLRDYAEGRCVSAAVHGNAVRDDACPWGPGDLAEPLTAFLEDLARSIRHSQGLPADEPLETVMTWPANANGAQRHITRRCFRRAGFTVLDTLNEPTASAIELADCMTAGGSARSSSDPRAVAVFDLGGGTFDASVVWIEDNDFTVLSSAGIEHLGGDDLDRALLAMWLEVLHLPEHAVQPLTRQALLRQARSQKETICTGVVRSLFLNPQDFGLGGSTVSIAVDDYSERIRPLLVPAVEKLAEVVASARRREPRVTIGANLTVYLVGGSSKLPLIAELVSEAFPNARVVLTDKPFSSVAMGAAICATDRVTYRDLFARHFGLIRLRDHGQAEVFDTIFPAGTPIPRRGERALERVTWYHPQHNIGHLRYLECGGLDEAGLPANDSRAWSDILFPYDPAVPLTAPLTDREIVPTDQFCNDAVCEVYRCDCDGVITVELRRPAWGDARTYEIYED